MERKLHMIHTQNEGIYHALLAQLDKLERHNRQCSYKTRQRYYEAMQRFCRFLADVYHLQKLANISGKHLVAYVRHLQENGKAASTIKTELAAIRFWHDKLGEAKYKLPSNGDLADQAPLERRKLQGIDRHWTPEQFTASWRFAGKLAGLTMQILPRSPFMSVCASMRSAGSIRPL